MKALFSFILILTIFNVEAKTISSRESRELKMAEQLILISSIRAANPLIQELCMKNRFFCIGTDQRELAIALIGARTSEASLTSLVKLLRFKIDGSGGEDRTCYLLQYGEKLSEILRAYSVEKLTSQCAFEVEQVKKTNEIFKKIKIQDICESKSEIIKQKNSFLKAIQLNEKCDLEDF